MLQPPGSLLAPKSSPLSVARMPPSSRDQPCRGCGCATNVRKHKISRRETRKMVPNLAPGLSLEDPPNLGKSLGYLRLDQEVGELAQSLSTHRKVALLSPAEGTVGHPPDRIKQCSTHELAQKTRQGKGKPSSPHKNIQT